jgi:hypothetical protein
LGENVNARRTSKERTVETGASEKCCSSQYINKGDKTGERRNRESMEVRRQGRKTERNIEKKE